jgi:hypothetical protein
MFIFLSEINIHFYYKESSCSNFQLTVAKLLDSCICEEITCSYFSSNTNGWFWYVHLLPFLLILLSLLLLDIFVILSFTITCTYVLFKYNTLLFFSQKCSALLFLFLILYVCVSLLLLLELLCSLRVLMKRN